MGDLHKLYVPGRIFQRHVGGNTTYARNIASGVALRGVQVRSLPHLSSAEMTALVETGRSVLPTTRNSVIHYVADTGPLLSPRTPSVVTVHGVASRWITTARTPKQERRWRFRVSKAIQHTDRLITVSESSKRDIAEIFDIQPDEIEVIPHGVDKPPSAKHEYLQIRPEIRSAAQAPFILYLGNIEPRKNLINLVRGFEMANGGEIRLLVAGRPAWNFEDSMKAIEASPHVRYLGFVTEEERWWLLRQALLFAFPSLYEGFGFPVLEALAVGTPAITTSNGSLAEVAGPARRFESTSADAIASGIASAVQDGAWRATLADQGPAWVSRFSWDRSVAAHMSVYDSIVR